MINAEFLTLATWGARWQADMAPCWRPKTQRNVASALRCYLLPTLGAHALGDVDPPTIRAWVLALRHRGLSAGTVRQALAILSGCLGAAHDAGLVPENAARRVVRGVRLALRGKRRPAQAFTREQTRRFLEAARETTPYLVALWFTLARTGLRISEALGLEWEHVDLEHRRIRVAQRWGGDTTGALKAGEPFSVDVSRELAAVLAAHRVLVTGRWVFPSPATGLPWDQSHVGRRGKLALAWAHLPASLSAHSFRHGWATALLARGEPLVYVQRGLNHSDPKITVSLYGSHMPNRRLRAVDALDQRRRAR